MPKRVFVLLVILLLVLMGVVLDLSTLRKSETNSLDTKSVSHILYFTDNQLFSTTYDTKETINLTQLGITATENNEIVVSQDGKRFCFVSTINIYCAATDGTGLTQVTQSTSNSPQYFIKFIGTNYTGSKLLFEYVLPDDGDVIEKNPNIQYGMHYYESTTGTSKLIDDKLHVADGTIYDFIGFDGNDPYFANVIDGNYYKLNLANSKYEVFSSIKFPGISSRAVIDTKNKTVTYSSAYGNGGWEVYRDSTIPDSYSQILALNYSTGKKTLISPQGAFAQFQSISVSPNKDKVFYEEQSKNNSNLASVFKIYSHETKQTKTLPITNVNYLTPIWISNDSFIYYVKTNTESAVYKMDLTSNTASVFLNNVSTLLYP